MGLKKPNIKNSLDIFVFGASEKVEKPEKIQKFVVQGWTLFRVRCGINREASNEKDSEFE